MALQLALKGVVGKPAAPFTQHRLSRPFLRNKDKSHALDAEKPQKMRGKLMVKTEKCLQTVFLSYNINE